MKKIIFPVLIASLLFVSKPAFSVVTTLSATSGTGFPVSDLIQMPQIVESVAKNISLYMEKINQYRRAMDTLERIGDKISGGDYMGLYQEIFDSNDFINYQQVLGEALGAYSRLTDVAGLKNMVIQKMMFSVSGLDNLIPVAERLRLSKDNLRKTAEDIYALAMTSQVQSAQKDEQVQEDLLQQVSKAKTVNEKLSVLGAVGLADLNEMNEVARLHAERLKMKVASAIYKTANTEPETEDEEENLAEAYEETKQMNEERDEKVEKKLSEVMQTKQQLQQNATVSSTTTASDQKIEQESQEGAQ